MQTLILSLIVIRELSVCVLNQLSKNVYYSAELLLTIF
jgi:hypothetical protein